MRVRKKESPRDFDREEKVIAGRVAADASKIVKANFV
jgi:hypothetical protein